MTFRHLGHTMGHSFKAEPYCVASDLEPVQNLILLVNIFGRIGGQNEICGSDE
jgi:hypothetical protein